MGMRGGNGRMDVRGEGAGGGGGKGGGGIGRNGHRRDLRPHDHRNGHNAHVNGVVSGGYNHERPFKERKSNDAISDPVVAKGAYFGTKVNNVPSPKVSEEVISGLEKRLASVQQDFTMALHKTSEKENEKFDLIFEILSQLQNRQAKLEESVRAIKAQYGCLGQHLGGADANANAHMAQYGCMGQQMGGADNGSAQMAQGSPTSYSGCSPTSAPSFAQKNGAGQTGNDVMNGMGGQLQNGMNNTHMQQYSAGMMHHGGGQTMFAAMPQVVVVQSPNAAGMQYAMPQMMSPTNSMQPMPPQMAMQFMGPGHVGVGHEMGSFSGVEVPAEAIASGTTPAAMSPGNAALQAHGSMPAAWCGTTGGAVGGTPNGTTEPSAAAADEGGQAKERDSGAEGVAVVKGGDGGGARGGEGKEAVVEPTPLKGDGCNGSKGEEAGTTGVDRGSTPCTAEAGGAEPPPAPSECADRAQGAVPASAQETTSATVDSSAVAAAVAATAA